MSNPTKILEYDLGIELQNLLDELKLVNEDIKLANAESGKKISQRLKEIEENVMSFNMNKLETGNFNEFFTYDADSNVIQHEVTGDNPSVTEYGYKEDGSGELKDSTKTFIDTNGNTITIHKTYMYTDGNITGIATSTTVTLPEA
ncbi:hypothetical protein [Oceanobacillus profundus]|uniref:Uncharacterized protein n=1 Tax=Oceanobacillus profundus TaxID=372463 RepID=A0A417YGW0_9BACI|nr:hypothetical protein [Oceanobacillus profundus]RHW32004.1 hypothetical protein D1B32_12270 [Oceanobacillus profundus]